ncbi:MAG: hypothetical protein KJ726_10935 [Verrucomicrobia bacterium]|nr:hypothetical protein [Verrucomicrobiota bacterium]MBU1910552.1 hypothetical protein [Verrucomicrobiota bacterium]
MKDVLLCLTALFLLAWVIYLKMEVVKLMEQNEKLAARLKQKVDREKGGLEVSEEAQAWGKKPPWVK